MSKLYVQFRSRYRGTSDFDVFMRGDQNRMAIVSHHDDGRICAHLTEFGEGRNVSEDDVRAAYAEHEEAESVRFLDWCRVQGGAPGIAA